MIEETAPRARRNKSATRNTVLNAGARVIALHGFHAATKERIGAEAGFSHQTVRDQFRTMHDMLNVIADAMWASVGAAMRIVKDAAPPIDRILVAFDHLQLLACQEPHRTVCVLQEMRAARMQPRSDVVHAAFVLCCNGTAYVADATGVHGYDAMAHADVLHAEMCRTALTTALLNLGMVKPEDTPQLQRRREAFVAITRRLLGYKL